MASGPATRATPSVDQRALLTIRHRLSLSFFAIVALMACNQVIYTWSSSLRGQTLEALDRALNRQVLIGTVRRDLADLHREVTLLSQFDEAPAADPDTQRAFSQKVDSVGERVKTLRALADPLDAELVNEIDRLFVQLAEAWKGFYQYLGGSQGVALAQLVRADPLSQRLLITALPRLEAELQTRVREAEAESRRVADVTRRTSYGIFIFSALISAVLAYAVSQHLSQRLGMLNIGAAVLGIRLDHRIEVKGRDEIAALGRAFNDMAEKVQAAQEDFQQANEQLERRNAELHDQRQVSESLLLNILPAQVAHELQSRGSVEPRYYEDVTILFTDFVGFTLATEKLAAEDVVRVLHEYFTAFDEISGRYGLEKMKTIGDAYFAVGGMPVRTPSHPVDAVLAALEMMHFVQQRREAGSDEGWSVRVGLHTGPVVAGVVGIHKFAFDVWGETVNFASRIESAGRPGQINVSGATYLRIKDFFACEHRGKVLTKEKREFDMYFVRGLQRAMLDGSEELPPPAFVRRYRTYFQKEPPSFPAREVIAALGVSTCAPEETPAASAPVSRERPADL